MLHCFAQLMQRPAYDPLLRRCLIACRPCISALSLLAAPNNNILEGGGPCHTHHLAALCCAYWLQAQQSPRHQHPHRACCTEHVFCYRRMKNEIAQANSQT